jgi:hypothetical protein
MGMRFILIKDEAVWSPTPLREIRPEHILGFRVPLHRPNGSVPA